MTSCATALARPPRPWLWPVGRWAVGAALLTSALAAHAAPANLVQGIDVEGSAGERRVRIRTASEPTFTVFRLAAPMRVVVDISGGDLSRVDGPLVIEDGVVSQIATRQFNADGFMIARIMVGFEQEQVYDVRAEKQAVVIRVGEAPSAPVERALPPPVAPVDRAAAERFETARREADEAAARAADERRRAEEAAGRAEAQQREATRLASDAEQRRRDAERAKAEAETLRAQAQEAISRDKAAAEAKAREAEARQGRLEAEAQQVAAARAAAERLAAEAERTRRNAEEVAAAAEAKHKRQVAELEQLTAKAQQEKAAADSAWARARAAERDAAEAQQRADAAKRAAEETRAATAAKLVDIATREQQLVAARQALAAERHATQAEQQELERRRLAADAARREAEQAQEKAAAERRALSAAQQQTEAERRALAAAQQQTEAERRALAAAQQETAAQRRELEQIQREAENERREVDRLQREAEAERQRLVEAEQRLAVHARTVEGKQADFDSESQRLGRLQASINEAHQKLEADRRRLAQEQARLDAESRKHAEAERDGKRSRQTAAAEREQLRRERAALEAARQQAEQDQARLEAERKQFAAAEERLARARAERQALAEERQTLEKLRREIETKEKALAGRERVLAERSAARPAAVARGRTQKTAVVASAPAAPAATRASTTRAVSAPPPARAPAATLKGVERRGSGVALGVLLVLEGKPGYQARRLDDPPRLVIDLNETERGVDRVTYGVQTPFIRRVRLGDHGSVVRVVLDLSAAAAEHEILETSEGLLVRMEAPPDAPAEQPAPAVAAAGGGGTIKDVRFTGRGETAKVIIDIDGKVTPRIDDRSKKAWVLELPGVRVPESLERSLDTSAYGTVVRMVSTYQAAREPPVANVVVNLAGTAEHALTQQNGGWTWEIRGQPAPMQLASSATPQTAAYATEAQVLARSTPTQARPAKKRISIDLKDADIVNVLRLLAEVSGENIIASDDVRGKITLKLRNVPWDQALDTILKTKGYDKVRQHNILRIAPAEKIRQEKEQALANKKAEELLEDTVIKMVTVNYADSAEIVTQLKAMLTARGTVQTDARTNTIIIEDVRSNIDRLVDLTRRLDKQTPQVLIEARIVEASSTDLEQVGVQWGGRSQVGAATGNATGLAFPSSIGVAGYSPINDFAVNMPAQIDSPGAGLGLVFGSAGGSQILNLRLTALEEEGKGRIISSPRITTLDNRTAKIAQGIDIPITVVSAAGANTRFIPANLELEVTPHVTNDGSVLLKIKTAKNEPDFGRLGGQGDPTIVKKFAETEVLVRDGDTTVIGGIYTRSTSERYAKVPVLGDIPVIGWLFKSKRVEDNRAELLVFITPRIINREESRITGGSLQGESH